MEQSRVTDFPIPVSWDRAGLEAVGFEGFVPFIGMDRVLLPPRRGVYSILLDATERPNFIDTNVIKRRKPYAPSRLSEKWIDGLTLVYIGMAEPSDGLFGRLGDFSRQSSSHSGGRALWQLQNASELQAAWVETPDHVAEEVEKKYLRAFKSEFGQYPFANWRL